MNAVAKPRFFFQTKPNRKGIIHTMIIEDHGPKGYMGQLTSGTPNDPNEIRSVLVVLDHFQSIEDACDAVGFPYELVGLPELN